MRMSILKRLQAYGNGSLALLLCVVGNSIGIFTVPYLLKFMLSSGGVSLDAVKLLINLIICILVPLVIGKFLLEVSAGVKSVVGKFPTTLKLLNNGSLIAIVWQSVSRAQVRHGRQNVIMCIAFVRRWP
jgi:predicted Na+-dependent transporter